MTSLDVGQFLSGHAFAFLLVFCRIGAALMIFPGIGEGFVTPKLRLLFALAVSFLVFPVLLPSLPVLPASEAELAALVGREIIVGLFFSSVLRLFLGVVEIAGSVIALQMGLSNAMMLNPTMSSQSALPSAMLSIAAVTLIFVTGLDHLLLKAMFDTYKIFPVKADFPLGDAALSYAKFVSSSFRVGVELAFPFLMVELMLNVALGFMQRMMPQVQLFLVVMPVQIWMGMILLMTTVTAIMGAWLSFFNDSVSAFLAR